MTANKIIKNLRTIKGKYAWSIRLDDALDTIIEALEKQIPKEPTEEAHDEKTLSYNLYCPACGKIIGYKGMITGRIVQKYRNESYCGFCGQAIDYGEGGE